MRWNSFFFRIYIQKLRDSGAKNEGRGVLVVVLADKYVELERFSEAIELYESCLKGHSKDNVHVLKALVLAHYKNLNYDQAIAYGDRLSEDKSFAKSTKKIAYAWSLYQNSELGRAEDCFRSMDSRFEKYHQRIEYSKYLYTIDKKTEAIEKLEELLAEFDLMQPRDRRDKIVLLKMIKSLHRNNSLS